MSPRRTVSVHRCSKHGRPNCDECARLFLDRPTQAARTVPLTVTLGDLLGPAERRRLAACHGPKGFIPSTVGALATDAERPAALGRIGGPIKCDMTLDEEDADPVPGGPVE